MRVGLVLLLACGACVFEEEDPPSLLKVALPPTSCAISDHQWLGVVAGCPFEVGFMLEWGVDPTGWQVAIRLPDGTHPRFPLDAGNASVALTLPGGEFRNMDEQLRFDVFDPSGAARETQVWEVTVIDPAARGAPPAWLYTTFWTEDGKYNDGAHPPDCGKDNRIVMYVGGDLAAIYGVFLHVYDIDVVDDETLDKRILPPVPGATRYEVAPVGLCNADRPGSTDAADPDYVLSLDGADGRPFDVFWGPNLGHGAY